MNSTQPTFRGVMTWSINWDVNDVSKNTAGRADFDNIKKHMGAGSCTSKTCAQLNATCGSVFDGCNTVSCGTCTTGYTCGGSNQCVPSCTPQTCAQFSGTCGSTGDARGRTPKCRAH